MEIAQLARFKWADIPAPAPVAHPIARPTALERLAAAQAGAQRCPLTVDIFDGLALLRRLRAPSPHVPSKRLYRRLKYNLPPAHPFEQLTLRGKPFRWGFESQGMQRIFLLVPAHPSRSSQRPSLTKATTSTGTMIVESTSLEMIWPSMIWPTGSPVP